MPYKTNRLKSEDKSADEDTQEYREKLTIILSIKVAEMIKKLKLLTEGLPSFSDREEASHSIFTVFQSLSQEELPYEIFRRGVVNLLKQMEAEFFREKLTMSEDDIRAVFSILDEGEGRVSRARLKLLSNEPEIAKKITKFYEGRINKRMVKVALPPRRTRSSSWARTPTASRSTRSRTPRCSSSAPSRTGCWSRRGPRSAPSPATHTSGRSRAAGCGSRPRGRPTPSTRRGTTAAR